MSAGAERGEREDRDAPLVCVRSRSCHTLDEFNHSHMKGHLSWPLETNRAFSALNPAKRIECSGKKSILLQRDSKDEAFTY